MWSVQLHCTALPVFSVCTYPLLVLHKLNSLIKPKFTIYNTFPQHLRQPGPEHTLSIYYNCNSIITKSVITMLYSIQCMHKKTMISTLPKSQQNKYQLTWNWSKYIRYKYFYKCLIEGQIRFPSITNNTRHCRHLI